MEGTPVIGLITFFTFAFSVIAAVLAIDMYALLRTGEFGRTWRILITASVMFALAQAMHLAAWFDWQAVRQYHLADIAQLAFVLMLAFAFYSQRQAFSQRDKTRNSGLSIEDRVPARRASDFFSEETAPPPLSEDGDEIEWETSSVEADAALER